MGVGVSVGSVGRKKFARLLPEVVAALEKAFSVDPFASTKARAQLAHTLQLSPAQVHSITARHSLSTFWHVRSCFLQVSGWFRRRRKKVQKALLESERGRGKREGGKELARGEEHKSEGEADVEEPNSTAIDRLVVDVIDVD